MIYQTNIDNRKVLPDFDQTLIWSVILLLSLGLVMVYSASIATELGGVLTIIRLIFLCVIASIW